MRRVIIKLACLFAIVVSFLSSGCAPRIDAVPIGEQTPIEGKRGVLEFRDGVTLSVVSVGHPPIAAGREFVAFGIDVQNHTTEWVTIDAARLWLGVAAGEGWLERSATPPDDLLRAYKVAQLRSPLPPAERDGMKVASGSAVEITPPELARNVVYRERVYYVHPFHSHYYYYYDTGARDAYLMQQETSSFLARLLRTQAVVQNQIVGGFVVFSQQVEKGDRLRLRVPVYVVPPAPTTAPTAAPTTQLARELLFEFHFRVR